MGFMCSLLDGLNSRCLWGKKTWRVKWAFLQMSMDSKEKVLAVIGVEEVKLTVDMGNLL